MKQLNAMRYPNTQHEREERDPSLLSNNYFNTQPAALLPPQKKAHDKKRKNNTQNFFMAQLNRTTTTTTKPPQVLRRVATFQFTKLMKIAISALSAEYVDGPMGVAVLHTMEPGKKNSHTHT